MTNVVSSPESIPAGIAQPHAHAQPRDANAGSSKSFDVVDAYKRALRDDNVSEGGVDCMR